MNWTVVSISLRSLPCSYSTYSRYIAASLLVSIYMNVAMAGPAVNAGGNNVPSSLAPPKMQAASQASIPRNAANNSARNSERSRRGPNKIIAPIIEGFAELRNPVALVIAAKKRLLSVTHFRMSDSTVESEPLGIAAVAPIDVRFGTIPSYELTTPTSTAVSRLNNVIDPELHPGIAPDRPLPLVRSSATQLNMRVSDAVNFVWEIDHNESPVAGSEVGVGFGFKVAF